MTGEPRAELTDYSGANLVNLHTAQYDPALLALFGLSDCMEKLPPLCGAAEICGEITPEAAEKPVCWPEPRWRAARLISTPAPWR